MTSLDLRIPSREIRPVFLSHQSKDARVADALVELLERSIVGLKRAEIRCTTPRGTKLSIGKRILPTLASEAAGATVFLCLVTKRAAGSRYVQHEIESRLRHQRQIFPVLGPGASPGTIPDLKDIASLRCDDRKHLLQLVHDVARELRRELEPPLDVNNAVDSALAVAAAAEPRSRFGWLLWLIAAGGLAIGALYLRPTILSGPEPSPVGHPTSTPGLQAPPSPSPARPPPPVVAHPVSDLKTTPELRQAGVREHAAPDIDRVSAMQPGTYAFVHARQLAALENAPVMREATQETYEVERMTSGDFQMLVFVSEKERVALGIGPGVAINARPSPDELRHVRLAVPFARIKQAIGTGDWSGPYLHLVLGPLPSGGSR